MRIALKTIASDAGTVPAADTKSAGTSFLDILLGALPGVVQAVGGGGSRAKSDTGANLGDHDAKKSNTDSSTPVSTEASQSAVSVTVPVSVQVQVPIETDAAMPGVSASSSHESGSKDSTIATMPDSGSLERSLLPLSATRNAAATSLRGKNGISTAVTERKDNSNAAANQQQVPATIASELTLPAAENALAQQVAAGAATQSETREVTQGSSGLYSVTARGMSTLATETPMNDGQQGATLIQLNTSIADGTQSDVASTIDAVAAEPVAQNPATNAVPADAGNCTRVDVVLNRTPAAAPISNLSGDPNSQSSWIATDVESLGEQQAKLAVPTVHGSTTLPAAASEQNVLNAAKNSAIAPVSTAEVAHVAATRPSNASTDQSQQTAQTSNDAVGPDRQTTSANTAIQQSNPLLVQSPPSPDAVAQAVQNSTLAVALTGGAALNFPVVTSRAVMSASVAAQDGTSTGKALPMPGAGTPTGPAVLNQVSPSNTAASKSAGSDTSAPAAKTTQANAQHGQADGTQNVSIVAKDDASAPAQASALSVHAVSQPVAGPHAVSSSATADAGGVVKETANPHSAESNTGEQAVTQGINTARLIQSMSESEMRVGMHSSEFGDISIRTAVSQQQLMTQISVAHTDLGAAISAHIPSVQEKFGNDFGLHASIEVNSGGTGFTGERQQSSQQNQTAFVRSAPVTGAAMATENETFVHRAPPTASGAMRLDIQA